MKDLSGWDNAGDTSAPDDTPQRRPRAGWVILLIVAGWTIFILAIWGQGL